MDFGPDADMNPLLPLHPPRHTHTHPLRLTRAVLIPMTAVSGCLIFAMFGATSPGALVAFAIQVVTGTVLATVYAPSAAQAYPSLQWITHAAAFGRVLRGLHYFGASAMVVLVLAHMARVFLTASYKYPRELGWLTGVALLGATFVMAFTGQLLRWDQDAIWSAVVAAEQAAEPGDVESAHVLAVDEDDLVADLEAGLVGRVAFRDVAHVDRAGLGLAAEDRADGADGGLPAARDQPDADRAEEPGDPGDPPRPPQKLWDTAHPRSVPQMPTREVRKLVRT